MSCPRSNGGASLLPPFLPPSLSLPSCAHGSYPSDHSGCPTVPVPPPPTEFKQTMMALLGINTKVDGLAAHVLSLEDGSACSQMTQWCA